MNRYFRKSLILAASLLALVPLAAFADNHVAELRWERDGIDYSAYEKVLVKPLNLDDVKVLKPTWEQDDPRVWSFEGGTGEEIQALFMEAMMEELGGEGGFALADEGGEGVLQIEVEVLSITPYIMPGSQSRSSTSYEIFTLGSGDVHVSAELRDGSTGGVLMLIEGERQIGSEYKELTPENHRANLEQTFRDWGRKIREHLRVKQVNG